MNTHKNINHFAPFEIIQSLKEKFRERARKNDKENSFPTENFSLIKEHNLLAILIPEKFGGYGANFFEYQQCLTEMAKGCAATASAFNMHNIVIGSLAGLKFDELLPIHQKRILPFIEKIFSWVVNNKTVFAAATTEPGIGARFSQTKTYFLRTDTGYLLDGKKSFVTMAEYADYYIVLANQKDKIGSGDFSGLTYFLIERTTPGVEIHKTWDTLGMRATGSEEVSFKEVHLPFESVFMGREGFALNKVMREPQWITGGYLGVYLGIMEAAYEFTCRFIKERSDYTQTTGLAFQPLVQAKIGQMTTLLHSARLAVSAAAKAIDLEPGKEATNQSIYAAKYIVGEYAPLLTSLAIKVCGGSAIHKRFDLERYHRDACCGALMPAVSDMCQLYLGKSALEISEKAIW